MDATEELVVLVEALLAELDLPDGWTKIIAIGDFDDRARPLAAYVFAGEDVHETVLRWGESLGALHDLHHAMSQLDPRRAGWHAVQLRMNDAGGLGAEFEYHNPERWRLDETNREDMLRQFADTEV